MPIRPGRGLTQLAASLKYLIKVSHDCPWGWVFIDLELTKENSPLKLFAGKLKLRDFGEGKATSFPTDEDKIRMQDPEESKAESDYRLAFQLEKRATKNVKIATARYEKIVKDHSGTLAAA